MKNLPDGSPNTANRVGSLPQVRLIELLPGGVLSSVQAGDHGEVGCKLQDIACKALLCDSGTSFRAQLAKPDLVKLEMMLKKPKKFKPEGVSSLVAP